MSWMVATGGGGVVYVLWVVSSVVLMVNIGALYQPMVSPHAAQVVYKSSCGVLWWLSGY